MIYYRNDKGDFVAITEGKGGQIRVGDMWVDFDYYIKWREFALNATYELENKDGDVILKYVVPIIDSELEEAFIFSHKQKPITEQFLLSKGWAKGYGLALDVHPSNHTIMFNVGKIGIFNFKNDPVYIGLIPTESQYEVLNQLLKLHP